MPTHSAQGEHSPIQARYEARIQELENEVAQLRNAPDIGAGGKKRFRWRAVLAAVLISLGVLLAPLAVLGAWARMHLVDTDRFVETLAPLAQQPEVQSLVTDQVVRAVDDSVDIDALVGGLFSGLTALNLPASAAATLPLLEGTASAGVRSLVRTGVEQAVASPQFAGLWEGALRESHSRSISVLQGDPESLLQLSSDGVLSLQLDPVIHEVQQGLANQGLSFVANIPVAERSLELVSADALTQARTGYDLAVAVGSWLPWACLVLLISGVLLSGNRARALARTGIACAVVFLLLNLALSIGSAVAVASLNPSVVPAATGTVMLEQLTKFLSATTVALVVLSCCVSFSAWLWSDGTVARRVRLAGSDLFARARHWADAHGLSSGAVGRFVEQWHTPLALLSVVVAVAALFLTRPPSLSSVLITVALLAVFLLALELIRRPHTPPSAAPSALSLKP